MATQQSMTGAVAGQSSSDVTDMFQKMGERLGWFKHKDLETASKVLSKSAKKKSTRTRIPKDQVHRSDKKLDVKQATKETSIKKVKMKNNFTGDKKTDLLVKHIPAHTNLTKALSFDGILSSDSDSSFSNENNPLLKQGKSQKTVTKNPKVSRNAKAVLQIASDSDEEPVVLEDTYIESIPESPTEEPHRVLYPRSKQSTGTLHGVRNVGTKDENYGHPDNYYDETILKNRVSLASCTLDIDNLGEPLVESTRIHRRSSVTYKQMMASPDDSLNSSEDPIKLKKVSKPLAENINSDKKCNQHDDELCSVLESLEIKSNKRNGKYNKAFADTDHDIDDTLEESPVMDMRYVTAIEHFEDLEDSDAELDYNSKMKGNDDMNDLCKRCKTDINFELDDGEAISDSDSNSADMVEVEVVDMSTQTEGLNSSVKEETSTKPLLRVYREETVVMSDSEQDSIATIAKSDTSLYEQFTVERVDLTESVVESTIDETSNLPSVENTDSVCEVLSTNLSDIDYEKMDLPNISIESLDISVAETTVERSEVTNYEHPTLNMKSSDIYSNSTVNKQNASCNNFHDKNSNKKFNKGSNNKKKTTSKIQKIAVDFGFVSDDDDSSGTDSEIEVVVTDMGTQTEDVDCASNSEDSDDTGSNDQENDLNETDQQAPPKSNYFVEDVIEPKDTSVDETDQSNTDFEDNDKENSTDSESIVDTSDDQHSDIEIKSDEEAPDYVPSDSASNSDDSYSSDQSFDSDDGSPEPFPIKSRKPTTAGGTKAKPKTRQLNDAEQSWRDSTRYDSDSSSDDNLEAFFQKLRKPEKKKSLISEDSESEGMSDFVVEDDEMTSEEDDDGFYLRETHRLETQKLETPLRNRLKETTGTFGTLDASNDNDAFSSKVYPASVTKHKKKLQKTANLPISFTLSSDSDTDDIVYKPDVGTGKKRTTKDVNHQSDLSGTNKHTKHLKETICFDSSSSDNEFSEEVPLFKTPSILRKKGSNGTSNKDLKSPFPKKSGSYISVTGNDDSTDEDSLPDIIYDASMDKENSSNSINRTDFKIPTPLVKGRPLSVTTPKSKGGQSNITSPYFKGGQSRVVTPLSSRGNHTYSLLKSLSATSEENRCHPEVVKYVKYFKKNKEELSQYLFKLYNRTVFDNKLPDDMPIIWNNRLLRTAGYCAYKMCKGNKEDRTARVELSTKVCDTAERVRDTLIHELCHAAVWLINGVNGGHGPFWKYWARQSNHIHPELPVISRCHSYAINTKFTYVCSKCGYSIGRHSKSLDTEKKVCGYCRGTFVLVQNSTPATPRSKPGSTSGSTGATPRTPNKFALFVKEHYGSVKKQNKDLKHGEVMKEISKLFADSKI